MTTDPCATSRPCVCPWCGRKFAPRRGGKAQKFCSPQCKAALHRAARLWALAELDAGRLAITQLKEHVSNNVPVSKSTTPDALQPQTR